MKQGKRKAKDSSLDSNGHASPMPAASSRKSAKKAATENGHSTTVNLSELADAIALAEALKRVPQYLDDESDGDEDADETPQRNLTDAVLHDSAGVIIPIEQTSSRNSAYLSGVLHPIQTADGKTPVKARVAKVGPVRGWELGHDASGVVVWLNTQECDFSITSVSDAYSELYTPFLEKARLANKLIINLTKSKDTLLQPFQQVLQSVGVSDDVVKEHSAFLQSQMENFDSSASDGDLRLKTSPFLKQLKSFKNSTSSSTPTKALAVQQLPSAALVSSSSKGNSKFVQVHLTEAELAAEYPFPAVYNVDEEEADEVLMMGDGDLEIADYDFLPRRFISEFALYDSDRYFKSLEIIPMGAGVQYDGAAVFASGLVSEEEDIDASTACSSSAAPADPQGSAAVGLRCFLSEIREWTLEMTGSDVWVKFRTDYAWYQLQKPCDDYEDWYAPLLKTAHVAAWVVRLLLKDIEGLGSTRLTFEKIAMLLSQEDSQELHFISDVPKNCERFIVVHGQVILSHVDQFSAGPYRSLRQHAFPLQLRDHMLRRKHQIVKLAKPGSVVCHRSTAKNPMAGRVPKPPPARATTTPLVEKIWQGSILAPFMSKEKIDGEEADEDAEDGNADGAANVADRHAAKVKEVTRTIKFQGAPCKTDGTTRYYQKVKVDGEDIAVGDVVTLRTEDNQEWYSLVLYMYSSGKDSVFHGQWLMPASETFMAAAADPQELLLLSECDDNFLDSVVRKTSLSSRAPGVARSSSEDDAQFFCRLYYDPDKATYYHTPVHLSPAATPQGQCYLCEQKTKQEAAKSFRWVGNATKTKIVGSKITRPVYTKFYHNGILFEAGCGVQLDSLGPNEVPLPAVTGRAVLKEYYEQEKKTQFSKTIKGTAAGCAPYRVGRLVQAFEKNDSQWALVRLFFRPEDTHLPRAKTVTHPLCEVFWSSVLVEVPIDQIRGHCSVVPGAGLGDNLPSTPHYFFYLKQYIVNKGVGKFADLTEDDDCVLSAPPKNPTQSKGKSKISATKPLATLDIFSGCGGLSLGLERSGVAEVKWAIESNADAGAALQQNKPRCQLIKEDCNTVLQRAMANSDPSLPRKGEVDFIVGGPPCQGFSGINRYGKSEHSLRQCSMVIAFLSYVDFYRPKYVLIENVRALITAHKGIVMRLILRTLVEMGYQIKFGALQSAHYGCPQKRSRMFIWAAAYGNPLPNFPEPLFACPSPYTSLFLRDTDGSKLNTIEAVRESKFPPWRTMTVRDAINDLPPLKAGGGTEVVSKGAPAANTDFQRRIRDGTPHLYDHVTKDLKEIDLLRIQRIPREPGADWRDLPEEEFTIDGKVEPLIPGCLPHNSHKFSGWRGLYGRLDWDGHFVTIITSVNPMGKTGMSVHPEQDRLYSVREAARGQGFPDTFRFYGPLAAKYSQIGNAVSVPTAEAIGRELLAARNARA